MKYPQYKRTNRNLSLRRYCRNHQGAMSSLARLLPMDLGQLCRIVAGRHQMPERHCLRIQFLTGRNVTARSLRPDLKWPVMPGEDAHAAQPKREIAPRIPLNKRFRL